jgi:hypothetical protein
MKAEEYYHKLLPVLYDASLNGKSKIILTKNIKELKSISSLLAKKLWKHGILNIITTPKEFIICLLPENNSYSNEYINPTYSVTSHEISDSYISDDVLVEDEYNSIIDTYINNNTSTSSYRLLNRYNH